jgi:hypothetical protein
MATSIGSAAASAGSTVSWVAVAHCGGKKVNNLAENLPGSKPSAAGERLETRAEAMGRRPGSLFKTGIQATSRPGGSHSGDPASLWHTLCVKWGERRGPNLADSASTGPRGSVTGCVEFNVGRVSNPSGGTYGRVRNPSYVEFETGTDFDSL